VIRVYDEAGNVIETHEHKHVILTIRICMDCRLVFKTTGKLGRQQMIVIAKVR
jgi:hypothetical protein